MRDFSWLPRPESLIQQLIAEGKVDRVEKMLLDGISPNIDFDLTAITYPIIYSIAIQQLGHCSQMRRVYTRRRQNHLKIVELLVNAKGYDPVRKRYNNAMTEYQLIMISGDNEIIEILQKSMKINCTDFM